jgi:hypothetical protein
MIVEFRAPDGQVFATEVPCEADPVPFARGLIAEAGYGYQDDMLALCYADGSPLR